MPKKTKIIISDTHIGAGGWVEGNRLEDFTSDAEFVAWLHALVEESNREQIAMDFIINGDWIEFLQVPDVNRFEPARVYETSFYTEVAEAAALRRLQVVYEWHPGIFLGLTDFLNPGPPRRRLHILFGNHDPEIVYPGVQAQLRRLLHAEGDLADLVQIGARRLHEDGVFIEHGNAYVESVNRFSNPDAPFDPLRPGQIERPSGSSFVTHFFNHLEWQRAWVDGVHPVTTLIFYALAFEPAFALKVLKAFLEAVPGLVLDIAATPTPPGPEEPPTAREQVLEQLADPAQQAEIARRLAEDPAFAEAFAAQVQQALQEQGATPPPPEGIAQATLPLPPEERARLIAEMAQQALHDEAVAIVERTGAAVVLFGHIHERVETRLENGGLYLNTGAWVWKGDFSQQGDEVWRDLLADPDKYSEQRTLTYARIDFDEQGVMGQARLLTVGDLPAPPAPPGPQPHPSLWARLLLTFRNVFRCLFGK